jgi:hypothetical protein
MLASLQVHRSEVTGVSDENISEHGEWNDIAVRDPGHVEVVMRLNQCRCLALGVLLVVLPLSSQNVNTMHPQEIDAQKHSSSDELRQRAASLQLQKDSKELSELCVSVSNEMDHVKARAIVERTCWKS